MKQFLIRIVAPLLLLSVAMLACSTPTLPQQPQKPRPSFVPSANDANGFEQAFRDAINQATQTGTIQVSVTQDQFTSWLALRAPSYAQQQGYTWPVKDVQASFDGGKISLYGVLSGQNVPNTPAQVVFTPSVDANGEIAVSVDSGQVGVIGVPADILKNLNQAIKDALTSQLQQIKGKYKVSSLTISGGTLTLSGQVTR